MTLLKQDFAGKRSVVKFHRKYSRLSRPAYSSKEIFVDNFAGGGGASTGIEFAIGRDVEVAINHDPDAIAMHKVNHPHTHHYTTDVWDVDPREAAAGRPVGLVWFSPDCKHFSKAKGGTPVNKKIRGLAWYTVRWAATVRPRVMILENVEEFKTWGPLIPARDTKTGKIMLVDGSSVGELSGVDPEQVLMMPDPEKKGRTFQSFVNALRRLGYDVEWQELRACDYGAATKRKRLFLVARCDGQPIVWPKPTHGDPESEDVKSGQLLPWHTVAEYIDWSKPSKSIFGRKKELSPNTLRRIARGIDKFILQPAKKGKTPYVAPMLLNLDSSLVLYRLENSLPNQDEMLLLPTLIQMGYGERKGQKPRVLDLNQPSGTITAGGNKFGLVSTFITKFRGTNIGQSLDEPLQTITAGGNHFGTVQAFLIQYNGQSDGQPINEPCNTITTKERFGLVEIDGVNYQIVDIRLRMLQPRELFDISGFPSSYIIERDPEGKKISAANQVARCGNAVVPQMAKALVLANVPEHCIGSGNVLRFEKYKQPEAEGQLSLSM